MFQVNPNLFAKKKNITSQSKRLARSCSDKLFLGVCGGLGENLDIDSNLIRSFFVLLAMASGIGVILYIVFYFIMPNEEALDKDLDSTVDSGEIYETMAARQKSFMETAADSSLYQNEDDDNGEGHRFQLDTSRAYINTGNEAQIGVSSSSMVSERVLNKRNLVALFIVFIGMFFMMNGIVPWYWITPVARIPLLIIAIGLAFLIKSNKR